MPNLASHVIPSTGGYEIDQSLRFNDDDSAYLTRTPSTASNRKTWTWSGWFKFGEVSSCNFFGAGTAAENEANFGFGGSGQFEYFDRTNGTTLDLYKLTTAKFRDPSAWYHIVVQVDTTNATASERVKIWFNGEQITDFASSTDPVQNYESNISNSIVHYVGRRGYQANYFDGYLAEVNFIDGQALDPSYFGETDADYGHWKPIKYTGTYGTNGFYLDFSNSSSLGEDQSGNSNNWTSNNLAATDVVLDSPTNNFATLNPLNTGSQWTLSEGNTKGTCGTTHNTSLSTIAKNEGKWYAEVLSLSTSKGLIGVAKSNFPITTYLGGASGGVGYGWDGTKWVNGSSTLSVADSYASGDIIGVALDLENSEVSFYKNNVFQFKQTGLFSTEMYGFAIGHLSQIAVMNFGQDSSFAGNKTAQGNPDANGIGDFYYAPPSGYLALCTQNLPAPTVAPADHFNTTLHTGLDAASQFIEVGFTPDWTWCKARTAPFATNHQVVDSIRGSSTTLNPNDSGAEYDYSGHPAGDLTPLDFVENGVELNPSEASGANNNWDDPSCTYVMWHWKANSTSVSNTDGTITSAVSANQDAGFSIVSYTGNGTTGSTVGHGLSSAPDLIIAKSRSATGSWPVHHTSLGNASICLLETTDAAGNYQGAGYARNPSSTTFELHFTSGGANINASSVTYIAYCFHSVDGFSKFGSYTGNGSSADGPFVYTGFRPAFVLIKNASASGNYWEIVDSARDPDNITTKSLFPNTGDTESTYDKWDFLSNGFKIRTTSSGSNTSGYTYIYIAFAEHPFKYANAR